MVEWMQCYDFNVVRQFAMPSWYSGLAIMILGDPKVVPNVVLGTIIMSADLLKKNKDNISTSWNESSSINVTDKDGN